LDTSRLNRIIGTTQTREHSRRSFRAAYDVDKTLRLALTHLLQVGEVVRRVSDGFRNTNCILYCCPRSKALLRLVSYAS